MSAGERGTGEEKGEGEREREGDAACVDDGGRTPADGAAGEHTDRRTDGVRVCARVCVSVCACGSGSVCIRWDALEGQRELEVVRGRTRKRDGVAGGGGVKGEKLAGCGVGGGEGERRRWCQIGGQWKGGGRLGPRCPWQVPG